MAADTTTTVGWADIITITTMDTTVATATTTTVTTSR